MEYITEQKILNPDQPMVANLSLGTPRVASLMNEAVNRAVAAGVPVVVAAGNGDLNACTFSPASAEMAITVAASTHKQ
jgi:subtilisin family serine protease